MLFFSRAVVYFSAQGKNKWELLIQQTPFAVILSPTARVLSEPADSPAEEPRCAQQ